MVINCENCDEEGMCVYVPKKIKIAVYQKCYYAFLPNESKADIIKECASKTLIQKLRERDETLMLSKQRA